MAFVDHLVGDTPVAYTIHVWPSDDLRARSWGWPERRRKAYAQIAGAIALAVATQVLEDGAFAPQEIEFSSSIGCVRFAISQTGTTIRVTISEFTNPDGPPPNGGEEAQPSAIDGLVLGLRGSNGYFHVVVFNGVLPSMPTSSVLDIGNGDQIIEYIWDERPFAWPNRLSQATMHIYPDLQLYSPELNYEFSFVDIRRDATAREGGSRCAFSDKSLIVLPLCDTEIQRQPQRLEASAVGIPKKGIGIFCQERQWETRTYGLPKFTAASLWQQQTNQMQGRYLH